MRQARWATDRRVLTGVDAVPTRKYPLILQPASPRILTRLKLGIDSKRSGYRRHRRRVKWK